MNVFYRLFILFLFLGCGEGSEQPPAVTTDSETPQVPQGNEKMVALLEEAYAKIDPAKVIYLNSSRADYFKAQMEQSKDGGEQFVNYLKYAYELLGAGDNEHAIVEFEKLRATVIESGVDPKMVMVVKKMLALAYIRLGETENCIERNNEESCIMPIVADGIYTVTEASRSAIQLYEEMLGEAPNDQELIWMLNFAYMTVGEYPDKVPSKWKLPEEAFKSDYQLPVFPNIASKVGVGTVALSGGTCIDDFNNNGLLDIIASSWAMKDQLRYFVNAGNGQFIDRTREAGLTGLTGGLHATHADYNNDGFVDVLVLRGAWFRGEGKIPNSLLRNNGDGTFTDVTVEAGLLSYAPTQVGVFADFNNDGWLDLFVGNESDKGDNFACELYFSNRDGTFTNYIKEFGLGKLHAYVKGAAAGDFNNDGWVDLYISSLNSQNFLLQNSGSIGPEGLIAFKNVTDGAKVSNPMFGFSAWFFDYNNDGWEDLFSAGYGLLEGKEAAHLAALNMKGKYEGGNPILYLNEKNGSFRDVSKEVGLRDDLFIMGSNFGDIDNDGWLDMYLGTGAPGFSSVVPNKMYRNNQGRNYQDVTTAGGFGHIQKGHGIGFGDFDNDGDEDVFAVIGGALEGDVYSDAFFLNPIGSEKNWVTLVLEGTTANKSAIGARVEINVENANGQQRTIYRTVSTGSSFGGNSLRLETGLGDAAKIKSIQVTWPNKDQTKQVFSDVEMKKFVKIVEGQAKVEYLNWPSFAFPQ